MDRIRRKAIEAGRLGRLLGPETTALRTREAIGTVLGGSPARVGRWSDLPLASLVSDPALSSPEAWLDYRRTGAPLLLTTAEIGPALAAWDTEALDDGDDHSRLSPADVSDLLADGEVRFFGGFPGTIGMPPAWNRSIDTGEEIPADIPWNAPLPHLRGDPRLVWDPHRFAFAFDLARAARRDPGGPHAERFWRVLDLWRTANSPETAPGWGEARTVALRLLALACAMESLRNHPATSADRAGRLAQVIAVSGGHLLGRADGADADLLATGLGLVVAGRLFPEFNGADRWAEVGAGLLARGIEAAATSRDVAVAELRWALGAWLVAEQAVAATGGTPGAEAAENAAMLFDRLLPLVDRRSGVAGQYGADDGTHPLPLSPDAWRDQRGLLQAAATMLGRPRPFADGPWDEAAFWLLGPVTAERARGGTVDFSGAGVSGLRTRRVAADLQTAGETPLHLEVRWRGVPVTVDPGTFSLAGAAPLGRELAKIDHHSAVTVPGLPIAAAESGEVARLRSDGGRIGLVEAQVAAGGIRVRRCVVTLGDDHLLVVDQVEGRAPGSRLHWLLPEGAFAFGVAGDGAAAIPQAPAVGDDAGTGERPRVEGHGERARLRLTTAKGDVYLTTGSLGGPGKFSLVAGTSGDARGWRAPFYFHHEAALSLAFEQPARPLARFWTVIGPERLEVIATTDSVLLTGDGWSATALLQAGPATPLVRGVRLRGRNEDRLDP